MARKPRNYVNNKDLLNAVIEYKASIVAAEAEGKPVPQVTKYIGECIILICENLAKKPNFSGYTYIQDMIADGIMDGIAAVDNFNPERTNNPFAYFTQIAYHAFLRRIYKEKKQTYIKCKNFENSFLMNELWTDNDTVMHLQSKDTEYSDHIVRDFEETLTKTKKSAKLEGVEVFSKK